MLGAHIIKEHLAQKQGYTYKATKCKSPLKRMIRCTKCRMEFGYIGNKTIVPLPCCGRMFRTADRSKIPSDRKYQHDYMKHYRKTKKFKVARKRYLQSEKGKATDKTRRHGAKYKLRVLNYMKQPKWQAYTTKRISIASRKKREQLVEILGGVCSCCRETDIRLLQAHHKKHDGKLKRKIKGYFSAYAYYVEHPEIAWQELALLCRNCHILLHREGKTRSRLEQMKNLKRYCVECGIGIVALLEVDHPKGKKVDKKFIQVMCGNHNLLMKYQRKEGIKYC